MIMGAVILLVGALIYFSDRWPLLRWIGRLPGDMSWGGETWRVHFPLMTSILLSVLLTLAFWIVSWFSNRGGR